MMDLFSELFNMFDDFDSVFAANATQRESKTCPVCGYTWSDFNRSGKFGCGECYKTFQDGSERVLRQIHSTSAHSGKIFVICFSRRADLRCGVAQCRAEKYTHV